jgi:adenylate kinase family enzyme
MLHTVIFIGRSGCGKGTQAELLRSRLFRHDTDKRKILYIESGDRFREFIRGDTYSSKLSKAIYELDERQPDFLAGLMWGTQLIEELEPDMHIVFDGVARAKPEAELLTTALKFYKREGVTVIYIDVSRKWSEDRLLSRGRSDDVNLAKIDKRLDWFDRDVLPAIEYFKGDPFYRVLTIDGEQTIQEVHNEIISKYDYSA